MCAYYSGSWDIDGAVKRIVLLIDGNLRGSETP